VDVTISENFPLKGLTTFKIGGPAQFFVAVKNIDELTKAVQFAKSKRVPIFVLGGGSNVLISDTGVAGLVIKMEIKGIEIKEDESNIKTVIAGAGENWDGFVAFAVEHGLYGLENLSLIPGTVGAAPIQNIGAYGAEVRHSISWVEVFDQGTLELKKLTNEECAFSYRDSIFKHIEGCFSA
jgi:UDP-N-acetylmuramate dehydrogenase